MPPFREKLKLVPDQLEGLIGDKRFLPAALLLVASIKTIQKPEISQIGAISDLKAYFTSQEAVRVSIHKASRFANQTQTLTDILIEELQNHLYLKTYYSDTRWQPYTPGQQDCEYLERL